MSNPNNLDISEPEPAAIPGKSPWSLLSPKSEYIMFYTLAFASWSLEICAAATGSHYGGASNPFIGTVTAFLCVHFAAFLQTVWAMATAVRGTVEERVAYLKLAIRLQRLLGVSVKELHSYFLPHTDTFCQMAAIIGLVTWAVAYRFRGNASSSAYWIIFLVVWIANTVSFLMNAYNNTSWESDVLAEMAPDKKVGRFPSLGV